MKAAVIGAGLAGCEAAWQLNMAGIETELYEMKPEKHSPAHKTDLFAELVCSNSLKAQRLNSAAGLLKEEMRTFSSVCVETALETAVPAGGALAVDRELFSKAVTEKIKACKNIKIINKEVTELPEADAVIIAAGPLASDGISETIHSLCRDGLSFYDAAAPIVSFESVDMDSAYFASRYDKGTADYINCPMNREQYDAFWEALCEAEQAPVHGFEDKKVFEGCMPVEVMGRRGHDTLLYGPLKPVGLRDPHTGETPYAVVQLRRDNAAGSLYNLVGFQTHLKFPEQKRVFSMIPALKNAEFVRYGVMHRNTFMDSPRLLDNHYRLKAEPRIRFAGQMTGVEGYIESAASGFETGLNLARELLGLESIEFSDLTAIGALGLYISNEANAKFQPMNINFGIIRQLGYRVKGKREKNTQIAQRALEHLDTLLDAVQEGKETLS